MPGRSSCSASVRASLACWEIIPSSWRCPEKANSSPTRNRCSGGLPFDDDSFDVAVSTLVLCGVDDQPRALRELRRVLRPGGRLLFIEHVRSDDPGASRLQDRLNWLNRLVVCCDCNRPTLDSIRAAGFTVGPVEHTQLPKAPPFVRPAILGIASVPADGGRGNGAVGCREPVRGSVPRGEHGHHGP